MYYLYFGYDYKSFTFLYFFKNSFYSYLFVWMHVCVCAHGEEGGHWIPGAGITGRCELPDAGTGNKLGFSARALSVLIG